jgi:DNA-binding transcriptional regulator YiaG
MAPALALFLIFTAAAAAAAEPETLIGHAGMGTADPLHYTQCGLPDVWLLNGFCRRETPYGDAVSVENIDGLHRAIALYLVKKKAELTGCEVRFLRKRLDKTQGELATLLRLDPQTVATWEKDQTGIPGPADLCPAASLSSTPDRSWPECRLRPGRSEDASGSTKAGGGITKKPGARPGQAASRAAGRSFKRRSPQTSIRESPSLAKQRGVPCED